MKKLMIFLLVLAFVLLPLTLRADVRVSERSGPIYETKIATNPNNKVVIIWTLETDSNYVMVQRYDSLGQRFNANMVAAYSQHDLLVIAFSVIMNSTGDFMINWNLGPFEYSDTSRDDGYVTIYDFNTGLATDTEKVNDEQGIHHYFSDMAIDSLGNTICIWGEDYSYIRGQLFNKQLQKIGNNFLIADPAYYDYMGVSMNGQGGFTVVYNPGWMETSVSVKVFDSTGQLDTLFFADESRYGVGPDIAMNYQGQYVVVWRDVRTADVWAQVFDKDNNRIGSNFLVSSVGQYINDQPRAAINEKGNFVVIWQDIVGGDSVIYAQRYLASGGKIGEKYRLNISSQARVNQRHGDLDVAATDDMIYFTWIGNGSDVYAKRDEWFDRGDVNNDGDIKVGDVIYLINYLFKGGPVPYPFVASGDVNCDDQVSVTDVVYIINYLFKGGQPPCTIPDFASH